MKQILLLTNYKGFFSSKYASVPYRSGMNRDRLVSAFEQLGFRAEFQTYRHIDFRTGGYTGMPVLYTSSEDAGGHYKDYVEDMLWGLEKSGARLLPRLECFRAHHNKIFMEILRDQLPMDEAKTVRSYYFGTLEDLRADLDRMPMPCVVKTSSGASSLGVRLARTPRELLRIATGFSRTPHWREEFRDLARSLRRPGYVRESRHCGKIVVQTFVAGLTNDWKVLLFGGLAYVLYRRNRPNDFRASGSGLLEYRDELPDGLLDFAHSVFVALDVPNISIDVAFDGHRFHLLEFQCVLFGSHTLDTSPFHYEHSEHGWRRFEGPANLEETYAGSVVQYLERKR